MVSEDRVKDIGGIFSAPLQIDLSMIQPVGIFFFPGILSSQILIKDIGVRAGIPAGAVGAVFLNQVRSFSEPGHIFGVMARRLRYEILQMPEHLDADRFLGCHLRSFDRFCQGGIHVPAVMLQLQIEGLVIDADTGIVEFAFFQAKPFPDHLRGALHAVAQTGDPDIRLPLEITDQHRHGIRVIQYDRMRTQFLDVPDDLQHDRRRAEKTEDSRGSSCIADAVINPIFHGNLNVITPYINAALKDGNQYAVRAFERFTPVCRGFHDRMMSPFPDDPLHAFLCIFQAFFIDIHQHQLAFIKCRECHKISHQIPCETQRSGSDKSNLFQYVTSFLFPVPANVLV